MDDSPTEQLLARISALESQKRRVERRANLALSLAVFCLFLCVSLASASLVLGGRSELRTSTLVTEHLRVGKAGINSQVSIGINEAGEGVVSFQNKDGANTLNVGIDAAGQPGFGFRDASGKIRGGFSLVAANGGVASNLYFNNFRGERRLSLGLSSDGLPQIGFKDRADITRIVLFMTADDSAVIELTNADQTRGLRVEASSKNAPQIRPIEIPSK